MESISTETRVLKRPDTETSDESPNVTIRVENVLPENLPTYYSDATSILHSAHEFVLSFLQTEFPLATSKEDLEQIQVLKRKCIARVFMSPSQFEAFTKACNDQLDKYVGSYRKPQP